jgi:hypothetical protein
MRRITASASIALLCASVSPIAAGPDALQSHRLAGHLAQAPEHHLQEARRALERAWRKATPAERERLGVMRTHFAELALAYTKIPKDPKVVDGAAAGPQAAATPGERNAPATAVREGEPTGAGPGEPPNTSRAMPAPAVSTKPPLEWQLKYGVVDEDLKSLGAEENNRALKTRIDHFKTHLAMFYAAALGSPVR